jgi:hypothetical protein
MVFLVDARSRWSMSARKIVRVQGGVSHFRYMLPSLEEYERVIARVADCGGRLLTRCEHGGMFSQTYFADPDGYTRRLSFIPHDGASPALLRPSALYANHSRVGRDPLTGGRHGANT